jgi:cation diffusion facilitator family transporter
MAQAQQHAIEHSGIFVSKLGILANLFLAVVKMVTGVLGSSYALVADGIESFADIFSSVIVWGGLKISAKPPDEEHPYGHGRAETIAAVIVSFMLIAAAVLIALQSIREIRTPHHAPAWFTLLVLVLVIALKESLFRYAFAVGRQLDSAALRTDAWHHRSDALTSAAAFVGISIALIGGPGYESADDWAALGASGVIAWNGAQLLLAGLSDIMDPSAHPDLVAEVQQIVLRVPGVHSVEKCRIRKLGLHLAMDIHVRVDGNLTVRQGHDIAHRVKDELTAAHQRMRDVTIHIEPA